MAVELDEVDVKLLTALQEDADSTNVELARLVGLSPAATLHRVRWLKESGVIRVISAQLDPAAAGFPLQLFVMATLSRHDARSERIFEPLSTTKTDGMGMGLPISRWIAEAHGGSSSVIPATDGAVFQFILPTTVEISHR